LIAAGSGIVHRPPIGEPGLESSRFLKKAAQKFLLCWVRGAEMPKPPALRSKRFLRRFFFKKAPACLTLPAPAAS
jgi:hypothetical protein